MSKNKNMELPQFVNIRDENGNISTITYRELKNHEECIIEDNIAYALWHEEYSEKEIKEYEKQARAEWRNLKSKLRENPEILLELDKTTERYIIYMEGESAYGK